MKTNKELSIQLVNQLVERAEQENNAYKAECYKQGKSSKAIGESFMLYHLKVLKGLIEGEDA